MGVTRRWHSVALRRACVRIGFSLCNPGFSLLVPAGRLPGEPKMIWPWGFDAGNVGPMTADALSPEENELIVADLRVEGRRIWYETDLAPVFYPALSSL